MAFTEQLPRSEAGDLRKAVDRMRPGDTYRGRGPITVDEYCALGAEERRVELIDGVIYMPPPPTDPHESLHGWLFTVLRLYVEQRRLGEVRGSRSGVQVSPTSLPEPDLLFFNNDHLDRMSPTGRHGAPDLAIEIVDSPGARRHAQLKQSVYEEAGVTEYWLIDLPGREVAQFILTSGKYEREPASGDGELRAHTVPGFHLESAWLFQGPNLPSSLAVVTRLLAEES